MVINIADTLLKNNKLFYEAAEMETLLHPLPDAWKSLLMNLFYGETSQICENIQQLLYRIEQDGQLNSVESETVFILNEHIDKLRDVLQNSAFYDITSLRFLFETYLSKVALSFESDVAEGLQIMGLLETRTLDFENIIMLSVNEGMIPAGKTTHSFIPYDVKKYYGLQTYRGKDAISSYHFYRLLQRANTIYLLYSLDAQSGNAEKSRFLYQLKTELQDYDNVEITDEILTYPPINTTLSEETLSIQKNPQMLACESLQKFSASSITTYLRCGLLFYFRYILGLDETNSLETDDILQNKDMGTIIHRVLEQLVENGRFRAIKKEELTQLVTETICKGDWNLKENDLLYEKNHLVFQVIVRYLSNYLRLMQQRENDVFIEKTEEVVKKELFIPLSNRSVTVKGYIDRIDSSSGVKRIIDYKTGMPKDKALKINDIQSLFDGEHAEALQLFFYAYLYHLQYKPAVLEAEIVYFRKLNATHILTIEDNTEINGSMLSEFETLLQKTIADILNPENPFEQTQNADNCRYCAYRDLCGR